MLVDLVYVGHVSGALALKALESGGSGVSLSGVVGLGVIGSVDDSCGVGSLRAKGSSGAVSDDEVLSLDNFFKTISGLKG